MIGVMNTADQTYYIYIYTMSIYLTLSSSYQDRRGCAHVVVRFTITYVTSVYPQ